MNDEMLQKRCGMDSKILRTPVSHLPAETWRLFLCITLHCINAGCSDLRKLARLFLNVIHFSLYLNERFLSLRVRDPSFLRSSSRRRSTAQHVASETKQGDVVFATVNVLSPVSYKDVFMPFREDGARDPGSVTVFPSFATVTVLEPYFLCFSPVRLENRYIAFLSSPPLNPPRSPQVLFFSVTMKVSACSKP